MLDVLMNYFFTFLFIFVPSLVLTIYTGYNERGFLIFASIFCMISIFFSMLPSWFMALPLLCISAVLYYALTGDEKA